MSKTSKNIMNVAFYLAVFLTLQIIIELIGAFIYGQMNDLSITQVVMRTASGMYSELTVLTNIISSLLTIILFTMARWSPVSKNYLASKPWGVFTWTFLLTIGTVLPLEWIYEQMQINIPEYTEALFEGIMKEPWGYFAIGIMAPLAEEVVFRGAILRTLLNVFSQRQHWIAITVSAIIFGAIHMNLAQGIHGFLMGLLLGWMYYRTHSIIPGVIMHWVNNSISFIMFNLMPELNDGKLIDLFHGDDRMMYMGLGFSMCIFLPSLFQLAIRMRR